MKISSKQARKMTLTGLDRLDPVIVIVDDIAPEQGSIIICCFGRAWTSYWGGMVDQGIVEFVMTSSVAYLADKLSNVSAKEIDYEKISDKIGACVDVTTALTYSDELVEAYGPDWYHDLPTCPNPDYQYLCRIIRAVQAGLTADHEERRSDDGEGQAAALSEIDR